MAVNVSAQLNALYIQFSTIVQQTLLLQNPLYQRVATVIPSKSLMETYTWIDRVPQLRQWVGSRVIQNVSARTYSLINLPFELTEELDRYQVEDNQINLFGPTVQMMAKQVALWPDQLVFGANANGVLPNGNLAASTTYDGQPYFSAAHPINVDSVAAGTQSNYYSSGQGFTAATYTTVRQNMVQMLGADGFPLLVQPDTLVVAPANEIPARQVLNAEIIATALGTNAAQAQTNVLKGSADLIAPAYLQAAPTRWYLLDTHMPIKPLIFQNRQAPEWFFRNKPDDVSVIDRHVFQYGLSVRGNAGYGPWFLAASAQS